MIFHDPGMSEPLDYLIKRQSCHHTETSQLICSANQFTGFYMMATLAFNELRRISGDVEKQKFQTEFRIGPARKF